MRNDPGAFTFRVEQRSSGGVTHVRIVGTIDEHADLSFLAELHGTVVINLRELRRINSFGVRSWLTCIGRVPRDAAIELMECPAPFIDQINMLEGFLGPATVRSFLAPYACDTCDHEVDETVDVRAFRTTGAELPTEMACPECGERMELNQLETMYLRFLGARE